MKAASDAGIAFGWQVENFSRMGKKMKNLEDHLKPEPSPQYKRDAEAAKVAAMLDRLAKKAKKGDEPSP